MTTIALSRHGRVPPIAVVLVGWATFALYLVLGGTRARCRAFDLALPVSARRIWLAHLAAVASAGTLVVACCVAMAALPSSAGGGDVRAPGFVGLGLLLESGMLLAAVLLQLLHPSLSRVPATPGTVAWTAVVLLGVLGLLVALRGAGPAGALVPLVAAGAALAWGLRSVPRAFVVVPKHPADGRVRDAGTKPGRLETAGALGRLPWAARLAILRSVTAGAKEWAVYPLLVLFGLFLGGALAVWRDEADLRDLRIAYVPLAAYLLFSLVLPRLTLLQDLDPLPVSRRLLFAGMVLPSAIVFAASWGAGALIAHRFGIRSELVDFVEDEAGGRWSVKVPLRVYRFAWDGQAPEITSPWGESQRAECLSFFYGGRKRICSPFSAAAGSSPRFVALQLSRAAEEVYGLSLPPEEIERRWLVMLPDGSAAGRGATLALRAERPEVGPRYWPELPVLMTLAVAPWLLLVSALFRAYRASIPTWVCHAIYWGGLAILILPLPVMAVAMIGGVARPSFPRALVEIPTWELGTSPAGIAAAWVGCGLILIAAYRLAETQFRRMEIPSKPLKYSLLERMKEER